VKVVRIVLTIVVPPIGVLLTVGPGSKHFWLNILLTVLGYFPGLAHGIWVLTTFGKR